MSNPIYENAILYNTISVQPIELNQNIESVILKKLKKKVEGKCLQEGYIKPNSVKLISRSAGVLNPAHFNGTAKYNVRYSADVCNPVQDQIIECIVDTVGKPGIRAYVEDVATSPLYIMLSKSHHLNNKYFTTLKENDHIRVKVINSEFNYYEEQIRVLAILENMKPLDVHNLSLEESQSRSKMSSNKLKNKISAKLTLKSDEEDTGEDTEEDIEKDKVKNKISNRTKTKKNSSFSGEKLKETTDNDEESEDETDDDKDGENEDENNDEKEEEEDEDEDEDEEDEEEEEEEDEEEVEEEYDDKDEEDEEELKSKKKVVKKKN